MDFSFDPELAGFLDARQALLEGITRAFRDGASAQKIAERLQGVFGRDQVYDYLGVVRDHDKAHRALTEAGLAAAVRMTISGIDAPRRVWMQLSAHPSPQDGLPGLCAQVREALAPFHLDLAAPAGGDVEAAFHKAEPVMLVKVKARS
ncbi:hypothetical protein ABT117_24880 [Streptomyces sp. NPDC002262]|uniref:hypothetical protein n=1 Tax=Streptomyces sp. NPDC002262 TaxID=3154414 RepID=UPI00332FC424